MLIIKNIWLILFIAWGLPLTLYRSKFRKIVYQTEKWTININPYFMKELKALFGNMYPENLNYLKFRNFYRFYLIIYLILFTSYLTFGQNNNMNKIKIGSNIPSFTLPDQNGNMFDISSVRGKKNLVIYIYPKDDSPGCTKEACSFRDQFEVFKEADAVIIGISGQSVVSHKEFAEKNRLKYTLLCDTGNNVRKLFGVPGRVFGLVPGRVTYVADRSGKVVYIFDSQTETQRHADEALKICLLLKRTDNVNI
ncbi:MAG: peroxiredoxin [Bacteroidales bacterium]|nr:peroxiredoxin [Bacteroidales bacterium]